MKDGELATAAAVMKGGMRPCLYPPDHGDTRGDTPELSLAVSSGDTPDVILTSRLLELRLRSDNWSE